MHIDLTRLRSGIDKSVPIDIVYSFDKDELNGDIRSLDNVKIIGEVRCNNIGDYILDVNVKATAILVCAITLKDVPFDIDIHINDTLLNLYEESDINIKNIDNTIDILPIIWENIIMEIPTYVVSKDAKITKLEGDGWTYNKKKDLENSELSKLKDLF